MLAGRILRSIGVDLFFELKGCTRGHSFVDWEVQRGPVHINKLIWIGPLHIVWSRERKNEATSAEQAASGRRRVPKD